VKEKWKLTVCVISVLTVLTAVLLIIARIFFGYDVFDRSGWVTAEDGTLRYLNYDGEAVLGWQEVEGKTYYFSPETGGAMATGWLETADACYYLDDKGQKITGWIELDDDRYYFDADGRMQTGWLSYEGQEFYLKTDGTVHTGWLETAEGRFFLGRDGGVDIGWQEIDGSRYYFAEDGTMQTGWLETAEGLTYLAESGAVSYGWVDTDRGRCYIGDDGLIHTGWLEEDGKRYFLSEEGLLHTGWLELDNERYYFHEDGRMAVGEVMIDGEARYFTSAGKYFVLVNPWHKVPDDYETELVDFDGYQIAAVCRDDLKELRDAVLEAGLTFNLTSAYRSYSYQTTLFQRKVDKLMGQGYSYSAAYSETSRSIAIPGTSEHQLGLAVDVKSGQSVYDWLAQHSWEYGFIVRYPTGQTALTGIYYEPWHLRYVGKELAAELFTSDLCVEAYMDMLTENVA